MKRITFLVMRIVGTVLAFFNALMMLALRPCWSGISSKLGYSGGGNQIIYYLPLLICILFFIVLLADLIIKKLFKQGWITIMFLALSVIFFIVIMVIIALGAKDYMRFVWPKFFASLGYLLIILTFYFFLFIYPHTFFKDNKIFKYGMLSLASVVALGMLLNLSINRITYKPVVYAVEDKYQIVFSTNSESVAWVRIGEKDYYDNYNGSAKKYTKIHKIEIPMTVLDSVKEYTVHAQQSIYCGPFGGFLGRDLSQKVSFKPVDSSDGLQYLSFSDVHMNDWQTEKAAKTIEKYDFLVLAGDIISDVETFEDANFINKVAYSITKGGMPVIYARGNHDVKGRYSERMHEFAGAKGDRFFYNFYFDNVYGIVLDIGEDHDDDWWEYYGTAHYEEGYRQEQVEFLQDEIAKHEYDHYDYHLAISHIPIPFINYRHNHVDIKTQFTDLLNQMDIDMALCGHQHLIMIFEPGLITPGEKLKYNSEYRDGTYKGYLTDFNFPSFMVSKPGFTFKDDPELSSTKSQIGFFVDVDFANNKETCYYVNSRGEKVDVMNMWAEKHYGTEIDIDLTTKVFTSH